jgi:hypothetical protein
MDTKIIEAKVEQKTTFGYTLDGVGFNVTLRTDIKKELVAFLEILEQARADISAELRKII